MNIKIMVFPQKTKYACCVIIESIMRRVISIVAILALLVTSLLSFAAVSAASPNISRSYKSTSNIPNGSIVSLIPSRTGYVQEANTSNGQNLAGVAVSVNQSLVAVNPGSGQVQIATSGTVNALVSNVNGNISVGQEVAVSPFNGVGMKSGSGDRVIGTSLTSFNSQTAGSSSEEITDIHGNKHLLTVGYVKLTIAIGNMYSSNFSIQGVQAFIESLTGHPISILRVIISLAVALIAIITLVVLIYASIYGSIVSIGRNPLAKVAVFRTLTSVMVMVVILAIVAGITIYLLLY